MIELVLEVKDHVGSRQVSKGEEVALPEIQAILECLLEIGVLNDYLDPFYHRLNRDIEALFQSCDDFTCKDDFLTRSVNYSRTFQKTFMKGISNSKTKSLIEKCYSGNLENNCYFLCGKFCAKNILDIILGFPDSRSTIIVLKKCLDKTSMVNEVAEELIKGVEARLLIPGVITDNILTQYINMLKILQIIDPQGIIFERITQPVKTYLLKRNDTLRCIIAELTEDKDNYEKLTTEVLKIPSNREFIDEMSSNEDEQATEKWEIVPSKNRKRIRYQESDLVTVLVNLYGSQEAFIGEYQSMMAEKFISVKENNLEEEITNIELLKKRFGESALHICNIIIKDIKDSKRIDNVIHKQSGNRTVGMFGIKQLNCLTVSKGYWPINYDNTSNFNMPPSFNKVFEEYVTEFSKIKAMRKNYFHFNLGSVDLSLTFDNGKFDFKCLPIQAMMITFFDEDKIKDANLGVSSEELSAELQIPQNVVKQKMSFWVHKGVVKEVRMPKTGLSLRRMNSIEDGDLVYYKPVKEYHEVTRDEIDELDVDNAIMKESTSMESHLRHIIEGLIISILNINGPKPCEKIHLLLKTIYKTDLDYTYQEAQTSEILKKMAQKKKIHFDGTSYASKS